MKKIDPKKKIILDADIIIHFCKGCSIGLLPQIFSNKIYVPDVVYNESLSNAFRTEINNLLQFKLVEYLEIKAELNVFREYAKLQKTGLGKGESACLAYCRYHDDVVGSSNLRDIHRYCNEHGIEYLTTMDFLVEAYRKELLNEAECDYFIYNVKLKKSRLPVDTIAEYIEKNQ
jgi:predicted nucleic acid-binding protein